MIDGYEFINKIILSIKIFSLNIKVTNKVKD